MRRWTGSPGKTFPVEAAWQGSVNHTDLPLVPGTRARIRRNFLRRGRSGRADWDWNDMASKPKKADAAATRDAEAGEAEAAKPAGRFSKKLIIMAAAGVLAVGGGGFGAYKFFAGHKKAEQQAEAEKKPAVFVDMPDVLVNLSNANSDRTQYLKVKIVLEVPDKAVVEKITPLTPRLMDAFQNYLRELRPTDLDGSAGLYRLKEELTRRVNVALAPDKVTAVLFKEIVVQ